MRNYLLICFFWPAILGAQSTYLNYDGNLEYFISRMNQKYLLGLDLSTGPYYREDYLQVADLLDKKTELTDDSYSLRMLQRIFDENVQLLSHDSINQNQYEYIDSSHTFYTLQNKEPRLISDKRRLSRKPFLKRFYQYPVHFFVLQNPGFSLVIDPVLHFTLGKEKEDEDILFYNRRGLRLEGQLDKKIYFFTEILETQARFPSYEYAFYQKFDAVPGAGFVKTYESSLIDFDRGVDFLLSNAYVGIRVSPHVRLELGHGRHLIGEGIRSLLLSDFATDYLYLKLETRIWKLKYQNLFGELNPTAERKNDQLLPKKYFAAHYLSLQASPKFQIGLFETVVFSRNNQFELQYLNPLILYRTVEGAIGSPDNVIIGLNLNWNVVPDVRIYGQFVLDEFKLNEIKNGTGWWANKYGIQAGIRYLDVFQIRNLDLTAEYNAVRPYTYSHKDSSANYSHYNQALAHPLGANFRELLIQFRYPFHPKFLLQGTFLSATNGEDITNTNFGGNILLPNGSRENDFNNKIGQGLKGKTSLLALEIAYSIKNNLWLEAGLTIRDKKYSDSGIADQSTSLVEVSMRWNVKKRRNFF